MQGTEWREQRSRRQGTERKRQGRKRNREEQRTNARIVLDVRRSALLQRLPQRTEQRRSQGRQQQGDQNTIQYQTGAQRRNGHDADRRNKERDTPTINTGTCQRRWGTATRNRYEALSEEDEQPQDDTHQWSMVVRKGKARKEALGSLIEVARANINSVEEDSWQEIEMAVDSGATETVVGMDMLTHIATTEGDACRRGVQ